MLDQLLELFERDEAKGRQKPGGRRSLSDRLFGSSVSEHAENHPDGDPAARERQDETTGQKRKPSKRDRLADLFEIE
jgi:hypothetical protein